MPIKHPKSVSVPPGTEVTFSCEAIGHDYDNIFVANVLMVVNWMSVKLPELPAIN